MASRTRAREAKQQSVDLLAEVQDPIHLKKIKDFLKESKSPQYMRNHSGLRAPDTYEVLYTEQAIIAACALVQNMTFPEDDKPTRKLASQSGSGARSPQEQIFTRVPTSQDTPVRKQTICQDSDRDSESTVTLRIEFPESNCHFLVEGQSLAMVQKEIQSNLRAWGRPSEEQMTLLHHGPSQGTTDTQTVIVSDESVSVGGSILKSLRPLSPRY